MKLPKSLPVEVLLQCHPMYNAKRIRQSQAFYEGGDKFEVIKEELLFANGGATTQNAAVRKQRAERMSCAYYTPHPAGLIEFFLACLFHVKPTLAIKSAAKGEQDFWDDVSDRLSEVLPDATKDGYLYDYGYLAFTFTDKTLSQLDLEALSAECCEHWHEIDEEGTLDWIRYHEQGFVADDPTQTISQYFDKWTFITDTEVVTYQALRKLNKQGQPQQWDLKKDAAKEIGREAHSYGFCPVIPIDGISVMSKLLKPAIALFNNESALQYAIFKSAFSWLCFFTEKDSSEIFLSDMAALKLKPGDRAEVKGPDAQSFPALFQQCDRAKDNLYSTVQSLALQSPSKDQGDRQSGQAKKVDRASIYSLLGAQAKKITKSVVRFVDAVKKVKKSQADVTPAGLDAFDIDSKETKLMIAEQFLALPGAPESAKKWILESLSINLCENAPTDVKQKIKDEIEKADLSEKPPVITVPGTGAPNGGMPQPARKSNVQNGATANA